MSGTCSSGARRRWPSPPRPSACCRCRRQPHRRPARGLPRARGRGGVRAARAALRAPRAREPRRGARRERVPGARPARPARTSRSSCARRSTTCRTCCSRALDHVAVVISDGGRRQRAYGLYQGDTVARDDHPDRIVIFRDTLRARLRRRPGRAARAGHPHRPPRAGPPPRRRRARACGSSACDDRDDTRGLRGRDRGRPRAAGDHRRPRARAARRADHRDRGDRRPRGRARARPRGDGRRRPRRADLAAVQARLLRARAPRADDRRGRRPAGRHDGRRSA